jgi:hypothetical protein
VLILPPGHAEAIRSRRPLSVREKRIIGGVLATVVAIAVVLVISFSAGGQTSSHGCIYVTIPAATGAQQINRCGAVARDTCASSQTPGAFTAQAARTVAAECRRAGLPVG